jgi:hypothetical protein
MSTQRALQVGINSPEDNPVAPPPPPLLSDTLLELTVGQCIPKSQAKASVAMYEKVAGGKRFRYTTSEFASCMPVVLRVALESL